MTGKERSPGVKERSGSSKTFGRDSSFVNIQKMILSRKETLDIERNKKKSFVNKKGVDKNNSAQFSLKSGTLQTEES